MTSCWLDLDIDVKSAISKTFDFNKFRKTGNYPNDPVDVWFKDKNDIKKIFNQEWLTYMSSLNLEVQGALIFYRAPNHLCKHLHVDMTADPPKVVTYGVNFVVDPYDDSEMIWYDLGPNDNSIDSQFKIDKKSQIPSCEWNLSNFNGPEIDRKTIGNNLCLVKTTIPHTVQTYNKQRWSFSLRFADLTDLTWPEAINKFSRFSCDK